MDSQSDAVDSVDQTLIFNDHKLSLIIIRVNFKNGRVTRIIIHYNFHDCDWFKKLLFSTNSLAKLLLDSFLLDSFLLDSLLSDSSISQSHSKL